MENINWILVIITALLSIVISWLYARMRFEQQKAKIKQDLANQYIEKSLYENVLTASIQKSSEVLALSTQLATATSRLESMQQKLLDNKAELQEINEHFRLEFKNFANEVLEEKSKKMVEINEQKVGDILRPLKDKIQEFEKKVDENHKEETRERISLKKELEQIIMLNQQVSTDTNKLASALKGDKKLQGNWGEVQLEMLLERAGLHKGIHYTAQSSHRDAEGRIFRPDYIIHLPEQKNLIIDAKVSLVAYEAYYNAELPEDANLALKLHLQNVRNHLQELGNKNYPSLYGIQPPDFVLMFVPMEPALTLALREDPQLFEKALERNIVLVSVTTLLATMRTISFIWKQENQRKNAAEIARESGALYDKFVGFVQDLSSVGSKMDAAKDDYNNAMSKLSTSVKKGDTIIGRIERIKKLGAASTKNLPLQFRELGEEEETIMPDS
jgi:DNA recombination protein RmuC